MLGDLIVKNKEIEQLTLGPRFEFEKRTFVWELNAKVSTLCK